MRQYPRRGFEDMVDLEGIASAPVGVSCVSTAGNKPFITAQGVGVIRDIDERLPCSMIVSWIGLRLGAVRKGISYGFGLNHWDDEEKSIIR